LPPCGVGREYHSQAADARRYLRQAGGPGGDPAHGAARMDHHRADRRIDRPAVLHGARREVTQYGRSRTRWSRGRIIARTTAWAAWARTSPGPTRRPVLSSATSPDTYSVGPMRTACVKPGSAASVPGLI